MSLALNFEAKGLLKPAAIGKGFLKQARKDIRNDKIFWLNDFSTNPAMLAQNIFLGLQNIARESFFLPAKRFECHFAKYEPGCFYKTHSDQHSEQPGRLLSCVLYLAVPEGNQGGELILYDEELRKIQIKPQPGRIVVFDSSIEHEVAKTQAERWSLTGWIRSDIHPGLRL